VATDRDETFAMATGPVDEDVEAVYLLDFLTGELKAYVLGRQGRGFTAFFSENVMDELGVDPSKNPRYLIVTGMVNLRRGGASNQPGLAVVYVAEVTTGRLAAYAVPWLRSAWAAGQVLPPRPMIPLAVTQFRPAAGGADTLPGL
jgi:hypothetical protein